MKPEEKQPDERDRTTTPADNWIDEFFYDASFTDRESLGNGNYRRYAPAPD